MVIRVEFTGANRSKQYPDGNYEPDGVKTLQDLARYFGIQNNFSSVFINNMFIKNKHSEVYLRDSDHVVFSILVYG